MTIYTPNYRSFMPSIILEMRMELVTEIQNLYTALVEPPHTLAMSDIVEVEAVKALLVKPEFQGCTVNEYHDYKFIHFVGEMTEAQFVWVQDVKLNAHITDDPTSLVSLFWAGFEAGIPGMVMLPIVERAFARNNLVLVNLAESMDIAYVNMRWRREAQDGEMANPRLNPATAALYLPAV